MPRPLSDSPNPGAALRAAAELRRDPHRSDAVIAASARCTSRTILRCRRQLEAAGLIPRIPSRQRAPLAVASRNPGARDRAAGQLALDPSRTNREIAAAASCSDVTAAAARRATRPLFSDAAAATDTLSVRKTAGTAAAAHTEDMSSPGTNELACCTAEYRDGTWQHDRSCLFAARRRG